MSIVVNVISNRSSWIASDGLQRDSKTGKIIRDDLHKFEILNPHLCIGYTGCYEHVQQVVAKLKDLYQYIGKDIGKAFTDSAARYTKFLLDEAVRKIDGFDAQFVLTGTLSSRQIVSYIVKTGQPNQEFICAPGEFKYVILNNRCVGNLGQMIQRNGRGNVITEDSILAGMRDLIRDTARYDKSVNTRISIHRIDIE